MLCDMISMKQAIASHSQAFIIGVFGGIEVARNLT